MPQIMIEELWDKAKEWARAKGKRYDYNGVQNVAPF